MIRTLEDFVRNEYPNHELRSTGGDHPLAPNTGMGEFRTSTLPEGVMSRLRDAFGADRVSIVVATPPSPSVVPGRSEDPNSIADVPKRRPLVGALAGGIVVLVIVAVVALLLDAHPAVIIIAALFAATLAAIEGAIVFGGARFAGEKAWDQQNVPEEDIQVVAVDASAESEALEACKALTAAGATTVKIVNDHGAWHLPNLYTTSE